MRSLSPRLPELFGWLFAAGLSVVTVSLLVGGARGDVLFRDGDAVLPVLIANSLGVGQTQDWAMSSVLFVPELTVFLPLTWLGLSNTLTLALAGVVWFTLFYGAVRLVAGRRASGGSPVLAAVLAHALFCAVALSESSADRGALDLASMLASSTYYAATVVAAVACVGWVWRWTTARRPILLIALGVVSAASTFSNPLFAVWAILPLLVVGFAVFRRTMVWPALALVVPGAVGLAARFLLGDTIVLSGFGYIQPVKAFSTIGLYASALGARLVESGGVVVVAALTAVLIVALLAVRRAGTPERRFVAAIAGGAPLIVVVALVLVGSEATRYLQPLVFYPVLLLTLVTVRRATVAAGAVLAGAAVVAAGISTSVAVRTENVRTDADLACVVAYVNASERTGAGQFWSVRPVKAQVDDPRDIVQVDANLEGYDWLVNRADYDGASVGYLVSDARATLDVNWAPADETVLTGARELSCGRYTITELLTPVPVTTLRYAG